MACGNNVRDHGKEIVRTTSTSTAAGEHWETRHESNGSSVRRLPRGGVTDASQGGGALPGELEEEPDRQLEVGVKRVGLSRMRLGGVFLWKPEVCEF